MRLSAVDIYVLGSLQYELKAEVHRHKTHTSSTVLLFSAVFGLHALSTFLTFTQKPVNGSCQEEKVGLCKTKQMLRRSKATGKLHHVS